MRRTIILHPYVTEKTMNAMSGTPQQDLKDGNRLEFVVRKDATKTEIKKAFEQNFEAKVSKVNVKFMKDGKHAIIKLKEGYSAEEIGMRIGIF
ncbi:MAG: 50S ribosomal protein L23 [Euryarchaeota archaeon RBG_19FT_COMBO_56_21]|nr:MAG: 50S ribosomal protein L23 [Euryarchaeota archaeon RBG_19FT_COMBO_56_21]